jgi:hypothetical protein
VVGQAFSATFGFDPGTERPHKLFLTATLTQRRRPMARGTINTKQGTDLRVNVVASWLEDRGFSDAATLLTQASEEVAQRIDDAHQVEWLCYQHDLQKAMQVSEDASDDLSWLSE